MIKRLLLLGAFAMGLMGCASERLTSNEVDTGSSLTDLLYQRTLAGIAKIRYYNGAQVLPDDFEVSKATIALNDTISATAGSTLGGVHGLLIPTIGITPMRAAQNSVDITVSNDPTLLNDQAFILSIVSKDHATFKDGSPADGCLFAKYENHNGSGSRTVWVDNNYNDMTRFNYLVRALMGDTNVPIDRFIKGSQEELSNVRSVVSDIKARRAAQAHSAAPKGGASSSPPYFIQ